MTRMFALADKSLLPTGSGALGLGIAEILWFSNTVFDLYILHPAAATGPGHPGNLPAGADAGVYLEALSARPSLMLANVAACAPQRGALQMRRASSGARAVRIAGDRSLPIG